MAEIGFRTRLGALLLVLAAGFLAVLWIGAGPVGAETRSGVVDSSGALGPRWVSTTYTPEADGVGTFSLAWTGDGDLRIAIYRAADRRARPEVVLG